MEPHLARFVPVLLALSSLTACASSATTESAANAPLDAGPGRDGGEGGPASPPAPLQPDAAAPSVSATGLAFVPTGGAGRRAWSRPDTSAPADVLDVVLTEWADACHGPVPDEGRVLTLYARAVDRPGTYPIVDTVILGGDGTSGQFSVIESTMLDRSSWPADVRPECGYDASQGTRWTAGSVTIARIDGDAVEGELDARDADGRTAHATFRVPLCLSRARRTIGCGT